MPGAAGLFPVVGALRDELAAFLAGYGQPAYRADQVLRWVYRRSAADFGEMTDLPKGLRCILAQHAVLFTSRVAQVLESRDGTCKLLVALGDGAAVESVVIPEGKRRTVCVSTQVGCPIGCAFCASGMGGFQRNLAAGEIVEQVLHAAHLLRDAHPKGKVLSGSSLTNIVVMGMGEPLMNYEALVRALRILTAPWGLALSPRRITVSTVGLPSRIRQLAAEGPGVNLAVSLHAADDLTRERLVPHAQPLREVVAAARDYLRQTGREVTFEYVLVKGVNDSAADARGLAELVGRENILVNLLPLNRVEGLAYDEPPASRVERFAAELRRRGVRAQVRRRRGDDIAGACGQLRLRRAPGNGSVT